MSGQDGKFGILLDRIANALGESDSIQPEGWKRPRKEISIFRPRPCVSLDPGSWTLAPGSREMNHPNVCDVSSLLRLYTTCYGRWRTEDLITPAMGCRDTVSTQQPDGAVLML